MAYKRDVKAVSRNLETSGGDFTVLIMGISKMGVFFL